MADRIATTEAGMAAAEAGVAAGEGMLRDEGAWKDVFTFEKRDSMVLAVIRALSSHGVDTSGVQAVDKLAKEGRKTKSKLYGRPLTDEEQQRAVYKCGERPYFLPRAFVEPLDILQKHSGSEGLFRKNGSVIRQRSVRAALEAGKSLPTSINPHDASGLLKQFLRELPNPLLSRQLANTFCSCGALESEEEKKIWCVLVTTLLLPTQHLLCTQALMRLLQQVAQNSELSKMDSSSLSLVMAPNLFPPFIPSSTSRQMLTNPSELKLHSEVIRILVDHAHLIGCVPPCIDEDTRIISSVCDTPLTKKRPKGHRRKHHKRDSISGLLINKFNKWRGRDDATPIKSDDSVSSIPLLKEGEASESLEPSCTKRPALMTEKGADKLHTDTPVPTKRKDTILGKLVKRPLLPCPSPSISTATPRSILPRKMVALPNTPLPPLITSTPLYHGHLQAHKRPCAATAATPIANLTTPSFTGNRPKIEVTGDKVNPSAEAVTTCVVSRNLELDNVNMDRGESDVLITPVPFKVVHRMKRCCPTDAPDNGIENGTQSKPTRSNKEDTIATRVRKRRESERESATLRQSFSVDCFPATPAPSLSASQSDVCISQHTMAMSYSCSRPLRVATKRKNRRLSGGVDKSWRERPVRASSPAHAKQTDTKDPSPGLLHQFNNELADRYKYTPSQLAPISNNDSYVCAMASDTLPSPSQSPEEQEHNKEQYSSWMVIDTPLNTKDKQKLSHNQPEHSRGTEKVQPSPSCSSSKVLQSSSAHNLATPTTASLRKKQKFHTLLTPSSWHKGPGAGNKMSSARIGNLSRRARQYVVNDEETEHLAPPQTSPHVNRRGIKISEWVL